MNENFMKDNAAKTPISTNKEWYLDVSEEQYEAMKAKGIDEEALFKPGRHVFRRRPAEKILRKRQTTIVLHLDEEVFNYFETRAAQENENIEASINAQLRAVVAERDAA